MPETTKTKIAAILYIIASTFFVFMGGLGLLAVMTGGGDFSISLLIYSLLVIGLGIFGFKIASALHKLKKWAYITAVVLNIMSILWAIFELLVKTDTSFLLSTALSVIILFLLFLDRDTFFGVQAESSEFIDGKN